MGQMILPIARTSGQAFNAQTARSVRQKKEFSLNRKEAQHESAVQQPEHLHDVTRQWDQWAGLMGPRMASFNGPPPGSGSGLEAENDETTRRVHAVAAAERTSGAPEKDYK